MCTSVEGGEYVPTRCSSLMISEREGQEDFKPRRGRSGDRKGSDEPDEDKEKPHLRFASPKKKRTVPSSSSSDDGVSVKPKRKRVRSKKSNKQASVESDKGQLDVSGRTSKSAGKEESSSSSALEASSSALEASSCAELAWGSPNAAPFRPTWGGMKGYDDLLDDRRADGEWAVTSDQQKRIYADKNRECGLSPPPKGMGRKTARKASKSEIEEQLWGREWGEPTKKASKSAVEEQLFGWWEESTQNIKTPDSSVGEDVLCK